MGTHLSLPLARLSGEDELDSRGQWRSCAFQCYKNYPCSNSRNLQMNRTTPVSNLSWVRSAAGSHLNIPAFGGLSAVAITEGKTKMKIVALVARILLGLIFLV